MKQIKETGFICVKDKLGIEYVVCELTYFLNEDGTFKYVFKPNYSVISLLKPPFFEGIPGLNLGLKRDEYVRENVLPVFVAERVPQKNREDLWELLDAVGLDFIDPIEYLIRTDLQYSGDNLYVIRPFEHKKISLENEISTQNNSGIIRLILNELAHGNDVEIEDNLIDDSNRKVVFDTLKFLYQKSLNFHKEKQLKGIEKAKENGAYKGRHPIEVDIELYLKMLNDIEAGKCTTKEACQILGISKDKFYRVKRTLNNK